MDLSVYIFDILIDVFIIFTIFAIYLFVLFRYFIHQFEIIGLTNFFKKHLSFYAPMIKLYKLSYYNIDNPNYIKNLLEKEIEEVKKQPDNTDYSIAIYSILVGILGLFFIIVIYFIIFHKKIMVQLPLYSIFFKIIINTILILLFELLFLFYVYGNTDLFNFMKFFNIN